MAWKEANDDLDAAIKTVSWRRSGFGDWVIGAGRGIFCGFVEGLLTSIPSMVTPALPRATRISNRIQ